VQVLFSVLKAPSTVNQAQLIKKLIESKGYSVRFKSTISIYDIKDENNYGFFWFQLATIVFLGDAIFPYLELRKYPSKGKAIYVTIEGVPTRANILHTNLPRLDLIAVSNHAAYCLQEAGLRVIDVVHHAVDFSQVRKASQEGKQLREHWKRKYGDKCFLFVNARLDPRKGLDKLARVIDRLNERRKGQFHFIILSDEPGRQLFKKENCTFIGTFGGLEYKKVLAMMAASHYLVFPSIAEGFGLPVLESNALGRPVIHCWFPPLDEFSSQKFNFTWNYFEKRLVECRLAQYWIFYDYDDEPLLDMTEYAIDVFANSRKEYDEYCEKAREHAKQWDYKRIYPKLLKHLGIV